MKSTDLLSREEIRRFSKKNNARAAWILVFNWAFIALIFAVVARWTNPLTIIAALILFGGRQLSLAVITHECGHGSMFTRWNWNKFTGQWLSAAFVFSNAKAYRIGHTRHHRCGGTDKDPDLQNYVNYAVTRQSFRRKLLRDITGRTGVKILAFNMKKFGKESAVSWITAHTLMWGLLYLSGHGWLYLLWPGAWMTSHMFIIRLRNAAEHAAVPDLFDPDPRLHTRTTLPRWWERIIIAPNHVNYHIEHHILPSVPCYRLREFHLYLKDKGLLDNAELCDGYWAVIKQLILPEPGKDTQAAV
jgi:fatty acid desaturase